MILGLYKTPAGWSRWTMGNKAKQCSLAVEIGTSSCVWAQLETLSCALWVRSHRLYKLCAQIVPHNTSITKHSNPVPILGQRRLFTPKQSRKQRVQALPAGKSFGQVLTRREQLLHEGGFLLRYRSSRQSCSSQLSKLSRRPGPAGGALA